MIKSPYYFVPFPAKTENKPEVFTPTQPETVSHDHPFKDGLCGHIEIELEATTPIYIRNAGDHRDYHKSPEFLQDISELLKTHPTGKGIPASALARKKALKNFASFHQIGNKPAIPGTSLKGPIRTILQILSKGRCEPVNDRRYSIRNLDSDDYKAWFKGDVHAAWVHWDPGHSCYKLIPCEHAKIDQTDLEAFADKKGYKINLGERQSAENKYHQWLTKKLPYQLEVFVKGDVASTTQIEGSVRQKVNPVFVGQITNREGNDKAKKREYVFFGAREDKAILISDDIWQGFLDSHEDTNRKPTDSWLYWRDQLQRSPSLRMPVFYLAHEQGDDGSTGRSRCLIKHPDANLKLHSFGLSRLYRLPYRLTMHGALPGGHRPPADPEEPPTDGTDPYPDFQPDFPSLLFGETRTYRHLKGRVSFGPLLRHRSKGTAPFVITVLGGPKPGFFPNYMKDGKTMMKEDARFRGWKFYAARPDDSTPGHGAIAERGDGELSLKVATAFEPLEKETTFRGRIRFHNLRPHELGALLWALTWGGRAECRHRLGMAKPLGYGCAKIAIRGGEIIPNRFDFGQDPTTAKLLDGEAVKSYCKEFETWLGGHQEGMEVWLESETVRSLLSLARHDHGVAKSSLEYPVLDPPNKVNEFKDAKHLPEWLDLAKDTADKPFTLWPDWMLPREKIEIGKDAFPGDEHLGTAARDISDLSEGDLYLCKIVKQNLNRGIIRVRVVGGDDTTEGMLELTGEARQYIQRLREQRIVAVVYRSGGPRNRVYHPVEI